MLIDEEMGGGRSVVVGVVVVKVKDTPCDGMTMRCVLDQLNNMILLYLMRYHVEQVETLLIDPDLVVARADHL